MRKLAYIDIQKWFPESRKVYNKLSKNKKFTKKFKKKVRIYDNSNPFHFSFWGNSKNYHNKKKKLPYTSEFSKKFGWYRSFGSGKIPKDIKRNIKMNFRKKDKICLVGWYRKKCLWEMKKTFKKMWYKKVKIKKRYTF